MYFGFSLNYASKEQNNDMKIILFGIIYVRIIKQFTVDTQQCYLGVS